MEITQKLAEELKAAVTMALDAYAQEKDLDDYLLKAVTEVLVYHETEAPQAATMVPVRYIGGREEYSDGLFNTGIWRRGDHKLVPYNVADRMFEHPSVYAPGTVSEANEAIDEPEDKPTDDENESLADARSSVMNMDTKQEVADFVKTNFGGIELDVPKRERLDVHKQAAIVLIDQYHLPEDN